MNDASKKVNKQTLLDEIGEKVAATFEAERRVLSFGEYLEHVTDRPYHYTRDAARYLRDCMDHFGTYEVTRPWGKLTRWALFDLVFESQNAQRLIGHELLQQSMRRVLDGFVRGGRVNRMVLFHGPNGSAKSTFAACMMRGLEAYSGTDEGALYRFSWVFPRGSDGKAIGFGSSDAGPGPQDSFAQLPEADIAVKLPSELREHPLLLLPQQERRAMLCEYYERAKISESPPEMLLSGGLSHKNQQVYDALLTAYRGDLKKVLAHVSVERWHISRRYRQGTVTIGPQMTVDAGERQITADRSLGSLPASLSAVTLFESYGELVDAAGGMIEYSDLLKRPLDAWKYLLLAIENGQVALPFSNLPINSVLIANSNELHLAAFREHPEYHSFRGRIVPLRVGYLRDYQQEQAIYDAQILPQIRYHVAPHTTYVAALWAVLTRLERAQPSNYDDPEVGRIAVTLSPMEKAKLYARGTMPRRLSSDDTKLLEQSIDAVYHEPAEGLYEGAVGASPREIRMLLLQAASRFGAGEIGAATTGERNKDRCLSPRVLLDELAQFCERTDFPFLKREANGGYQDYTSFVAQVRHEWLSKVDDELRISCGLIDEGQHLSLFETYVQNASHSVKKEKLFDAESGESSAPDEELMSKVESIITDEDHDAFRGDLLSAIAGWALDHPDQPVDYTRLFPRYLSRIQDSYFEEQKEQVGRIATDIVASLADGTAELDDELANIVSQAHRRMISEFGYQDSSLQIALAELLRDRYTEVS